jgi:uncharacterized membrane protein
MSYGLLSALSCGISTLLAAVAARRIGALRTVVIGELAGLAGYWTLFLIGHFSLRGAGGSVWLLVLAGVIAVAGYLAMYRGLESGHVGLVSAISACYGGVIAVLSVTLLRERLTVEASVGIVVTVAGVMLAVAQRRAAQKTPETAGIPGILETRKARNRQHPGNPGQPGSRVGPNPAGTAIGAVFGRAGRRRRADLLACWKGTAAAPLPVLGPQAALRAGGGLPSATWGPVIAGTGTRAEIASEPATLPPVVAAGSGTMSAW